MWRKENLNTILGMQMGATTMANRMEVPQETNNGVAIPLLGICPDKTVAIPLLGICPDKTDLKIHAP